MQTQVANVETPFRLTQEEIKLLPPPMPGRQCPEPFFKRNIIRVFEMHPYTIAISYQAEYKLFHAEVVVGPSTFSRSDENSLVFITRAMTGLAVQRHDDLDQCYEAVLKFMEAIHNF